jgi:hypothetical protein
LLLGGEVALVLKPGADELGRTGRVLDAFALLAVAPAWVLTISTINRKLSFCHVGVWQRDSLGQAFAVNSFNDVIDRGGVPGGVASVGRGKDTLPLKPEDGFGGYGEACGNLFEPQGAGSW